MPTPQTPGTTRAIGAPFPASRPLPVLLIRGDDPPRSRPRGDQTLAWWEDNSARPGHAPARPCARRRVQQLWPIDVHRRRSMGHSCLTKAARARPAASLRAVCAGLRPEVSRVGGDARMVAMTTMTTRQQRQRGTSPVAIELRSVHKHFGQVRAVRGIDLAIAPGEIVALLGPNGAGKTTTIDMILGLSQPTDGQVSVYGMHPRQAIERGLISAVLQTGGPAKDPPVAQNPRETASPFAGGRPVGEGLWRGGHH